MTTATAPSVGDITIGVNDEESVSISEQIIESPAEKEPTKINDYTLADRLRRSRETYERWMANDAERFMKNYAAYELLVAAGLPTGTLCGDSIDINVEPSDIPKYVRALGTMEHYTKDLIDGDDEHLMVSIRPKAYSTVTLNYKRQIKPKDKCKIAYEEIEPKPATVRRYVACSV